MIVAEGDPPYEFGDTFRREPVNVSPNILLRSDNTPSTRQIQSQQKQWFGADFVSLTAHMFRNSQKRRFFSNFGLVIRSLYDELLPEVPKASRQTYLNVF